MNFGLELYIPYVLYGSFILAFFLSVLWRPIVGIYYLTPLIPLQTIRYRLNEFPLGDSITGVMLLGVALGLLRRRQWATTPWNMLLYVYVAFTFVSLCLGSFYLNSPLPFFPDDPRFAEWRAYVIMPVMLILVAATVTEVSEMKVLIGLMCLSVLALDRSFWNTVLGRDFSIYSDDLRDAGAMGYAGANGLGAFAAQFTCFLLALAAFERKLLFRLGYIGLAVYSATCLIYSFSRSGYLAFLAGWLFLGLVKQRHLLIMLAIFSMVWASLVPNAVRMRVESNYEGGEVNLDNSSETRVTLWEDAMHVFASSPVVGTGFNTYAYMGRLTNYADTHNIYLKILVETGVVGLLLFLWFLGKTFRMGYTLSRQARDPFLASLGLGLAAWVVCATVANFFGDRWMFLQVNGYLWVISGLVGRAWILEHGGSLSATEATQFAVASGAAPARLKPKTLGS